jgi:hypothetical protein
MRRALIGLLFIVHGLAHSAAGVWATSFASPWLVTPLWLVAEVGFIAAGLGILGVPVLRPVWERIGIAAAGASIALLTVFGSKALLLGLLVDATVLVVGLAFAETVVTSQPGVVPNVRAPRGFGSKILFGIGWAFLVYVTLVVGLRPWHTRWGTSDAERHMALPGDELGGDAHYRMDHAVTVRAPADSVWPWIVQIGQDRGGFYSYDKLERLVGDRIRNADRVHPEWQQRQVGDLVRAVQPDYLGGRLGSEIGWRVAQIEPGRAMVLENWGAFVVRPVDDRTSRVHVRMRGDGHPSVLGVALGPASLLVFEPAHFIMERRMLLGIRDRAEGRNVRRS